MLMYNKVTSGFPLSIGTSLAMESILPLRSHPYDPDRVIPKIDPSKYGYHFWNVSTLVRNYINGFDIPAKEILKDQSSEQIIEEVHEEIELIQEIYRIEGEGKITPIFYKSFQTVKENDFKKPYREYIRPRVFKGFIGELALRLDMLTNRFHVDSVDRLKQISHKSLITTHIPKDLLLLRNPRQTDLLESHTGILKNRTRWNTKYYPVKGYEPYRLPFNEILLILLGDRISLSPHGIKLRKEIMELSIKDRWTPLTNEKQVFNNVLNILK